MSVARCKQEVGPDEFRQWLGYARLDPIGEVHADLRNAQLSSVVANCMSSGKRYSPDDFMLEFKTRRQRKQEVAARLMAFTRRHNARVKRQRGG